MARMVVTYSVFVGHLHPDVNQSELGSLFEPCGDLAEVVIMDSTNKGPYNFGFVRYKQLASAYRAVSELNHWKLKDIELVVQLSKDTLTKLEQEKIDSKTDVADRNIMARNALRQRSSMMSRPSTSKSNTFLKDLMYLNRVKENCTALNLQHTDDQVDTGYLLDDIDRSESGRSPTVWGGLDEPSTDFDIVSKKIMQRCQASGGCESQVFGEKMSADFMAALKTIMKEINSLLGNDHLKELKVTEKKDAFISGDISAEKDMMDISQTKSVQMSEIISNQSEDDPVHIDTVTSKLTETIKQSLDVGHGDLHSQNKFQNDSLEKSLLNTSLSSVESTDFNDPAILDFHVSKEMKRAWSNLANDERSDIDAVYESGQVCPNANLLDSLFAKMIATDGLERNLKRSSSRDSSLSEGSVEDSGVESDCFGGIGAQGDHVKMKRDSYVDEAVNVVRSNVGITGRRRLVEPATDCKVTQQKVEKVPFSLADYVHKSVGRGRGLWQNDTNRLQMHRRGQPS